MDRRDFLKASAAAGTIAWAAPSITTVARAAAAGSVPCDVPPGPCLAVGYGFYLDLGILVHNLILGENGCVLLADANIPGVSVASGTVCGGTSTNPCSSFGSAEGLLLQIGTITIAAVLLRATANSTGDCECTTQGDSEVVGLVINGHPITPPGDPLDVTVKFPPNFHVDLLEPLVGIVINEQTCSGDALQVNALHVTSDVLGLDLIIGHAEAGRANCTCTIPAEGEHHGNDHENDGHGNDGNVDHENDGHGNDGNVDHGNGH